MITERDSERETADDELPMSSEASDATPPDEPDIHVQDDAVASNRTWPVRINLPPRARQIARLALRWVVVPFAMLVVLGLFVDLVVMPWLTHQGDEFPAPDLVGRTVEEARQRLAEEDCELEIDSRRHSADHPPDVVLLQRPIAGYPVKTERRFKVVVSLGAETVLIPTVRGYSLRQAHMILVEAGLSPGQMATIDDPALPRGVVAATVPGAGSDVLTGTTVNILVNDPVGTGSVWMPNLVGQSLDEATRVLTAHRLVIRDINHVLDSTLLPGTVIGQSEIPGFELPDGAQVDLTVSSDE